MTGCPKCGKDLNEGAIRCIHCGSFLDKEMKDSTMASPPMGSPQIEEKFDFWNLGGLTIGIVILFILLGLYQIITDPQITNILWTIFVLILGYWCGSYAAQHYAPKINGSQSWAFVIGFIFAIIGFICYWIYYRYKLKKIGSAYSSGNVHIPPVNNIHTDKLSNDNIQPASQEVWNAIKSFLKVIGWIIVILIVLLLGSIILIGSGILTEQKSTEVVHTSTAPSSVSSSSAYSTYQNKSLGYTIDIPSGWTYQIRSDTQIQFDSPDESSTIIAEVVDLSDTQYSSYSLEELTNFFLRDSSNKNLQLITNKVTTLSGNDARELVYTDYNTGNENNKFKIIQIFAKSGNKFYVLTFETYERNFDTASKVVPTVFNSFAIQKPQYTSVQSQPTSNYLQGSESNNPYAASGIYAQRILSCQHGDNQDWDYCAQQCRIANSQGVYCNEQTLKVQWDKNH